MKSALVPIGLLTALLLTACANFSVGIGLPIGGLGGVGVAVNTDGRVSGNVAVGSGGVLVGVGGTAEVPKPRDPVASAPTP